MLLKKIILVTGGARSGKSRIAENMVKEKGKRVLYVATAIPFDREMKDRIEKHKSTRPKHWFTYEAYKNFEEDGLLFDEYEVVLVDCLTIMITNLILEDWNDQFNPSQIDELEDKVNREITGLLNMIKRAGCCAVLVSNEVGMGLVPDNPLGRVFRDIAGRINQKVAQEADEVYFCVSGIPMKIKGD